MLIGKIGGKQVLLLSADSLVLLCLFSIFVGFISQATLKSSERHTVNRKCIGHDDFKSTECNFRVQRYLSSFDGWA